MTVDGNLNVPLLGWGIWDYKGGLKVGRPNTRIGFGSLNGPTNVLGISPDTLASLAKDGTFQQARSKSSQRGILVSKIFLEYFSA